MSIGSPDGRSSPDERHTLARATAPPSEQPIRLDRLPAALDLERPGRLRVEPLSHTPPGGRRDEHLSDPRSLLEPRGDVDRIPHHARLRPVPHRTRHDQPAVDPDSERERRRRPLGSPADGLLHRERGLDGAHGVVLVCDGSAVDGHDRVADELLDPPLSPLDFLGQLREGVGHQSAELLGIEVLGERREADEVGEEHGHDPALAGGSRRLSPSGVRPRLDAGAAGRAEGGAARQGRAAAGTGLLQRRAAARTEARLGRVLVSARGTAHASIESRSGRERHGRSAPRGPWTRGRAHGSGTRRVRWRRP